MSVKNAGAIWVLVPATYRLPPHVKTNGSVAMGEQEYVLVAESDLANEPRDIVDGWGKLMSFDFSVGPTKNQTRPGTTITFAGDANNALIDLSHQTKREPERLLLEGLALRRQLEETRRNHGRILIEEKGNLSEVEPFPLPKAM